MGIFDFDNNCVSGNTKVKDECIIALKVYDACRQQDCLTVNEIGPARAAVSGTFCSNISLEQGEVITPPDTAAAVTINNFGTERVIVVSKTPSPFRVGYWDVDLKYVFSYDLVFRNVNGGVLCTIPAQSVYNKKVTLFGSITTDSTISTDFLTDGGTSFDTGSQPFVLVESKAVALSADLEFGCCCDGGDGAYQVNVTIGLFTIIKLFRLVNLTVESKGFCIPKECEDVSNLSACDYFDGLDFPMDVFAPPQKKEFLAGISGNIPNDNSNVGSGNNNNGCNCGCNNNVNSNNGCNSCGCRF